MNRPRIIIFEGISGSGKTTLFHPVHALSNYGDLLIHRLTPTHWVMDRVAGRRLSDFADIEEDLQRMTDVYVVWTDCAASVAASRQVEKQDTRVENLIRAQALFGEYFDCHTKFRNVIRLATDELTIDECVARIYDEIYAPSER